MMFRLVAAAAFALGVSAVEPAFPGSSLENAAKIAEIVKAAESSDKYSQLAGDQGKALSAAVANAKAILTEEVADANKLSSLKKDAYL